MISLDATQLAIVASDYKACSWLFKVEIEGTTYYWSTKDKSYDGNDYVFKILPGSFGGITLNRAKSEVGIQASNGFTFSVSNKDNTLDRASFTNQTVTLYLLVADRNNESVIRTWKFVIKKCESFYQKLYFTCEDFIQKYLEGFYPNTKLIKDIVHSDDPNINEACVPVVIGTAFIPLKSIYISDQRYYLLGSDTPDYTISKVHAPFNKGDTTWLATNYVFKQVTKTIDAVDWKVFQPIIYSLGTGSHTGANDQAVLTNSTASWTTNAFVGATVVNITDNYSYGTITGNTDTTITATLAGGTGNEWDTGDSYMIGGCGLWNEGLSFVDMPTKFSRSDTVSKTNPADAIEYILEDMGVPSAQIDTGGGSSFETAATAFDAYAPVLTFNGAFYFKEQRRKIIAELMNSCHATLIPTDKIELHILSKTVRKTITKADVLRPETGGEGSFKYTIFTENESDSGYVEHQDIDTPQDQLVKVLVSTGSTTDYISDEVLTTRLLNNSINSQRAGILYYQRKFLNLARVTFSGKGTLLALQPDDVIGVNEDDYGGTYTSVLIDSMKINSDLSIDFTCTRYA